MNKDKFLVKDGNRAEWGVPEGYPYKEQSELVIEWDGNTESKLVVMNMYYKVSDAILDDEAIKNGILYIQTSNGTNELAIKDFWDYVTITNEYVSSPLFAVVKVDNAGEGLLSEAGVYFVKNDDDSFVTKFFTISEIIHTTAAEFLPTETWTFTLEDGSTVTKKVAIGK